MNRVVNELSLHYKFDVNQRSLTYVSSSAFSLFGFLPSELLSRPFSFFESLILEEDRPISNSKLFLCEELPGIHRVSYRIHSKNGTIKNILDSFKGIVDEDGNLLAIEGEIVEDTGLLDQVAAGELKAYRDAIDVNTIVSVTDTKGTILFANNKFCEISKYSIEELVGQNHRIINSGHHSKEFFAEMWNTILSGNTWNGEVLNRAKDGSLYWVDSVIIPIFNNRGKITRFLSLRHVITYRKDAERRHELYTRALEEIAFAVSHRFRGPVCTILGLINLMTNYQDKNRQNDEELLSHLIKASNKLEGLTNELTMIINKSENILNDRKRFQEFSNSKQMQSNDEHKTTQGMNP